MPWMYLYYETIFDQKKKIWNFSCYVTFSRICKTKYFFQVITSEKCQKQENEKFEILKKQEQNIRKNFFLKFVFL